MNYSATYYTKSSFMEYRQEIEIGIEQRNDAHKKQSDSGDLDFQNERLVTTSDSENLG